MISAILMAGYNNQRTVKRYSKIVAEHYGEKFIETGYKPLREFKTVADGRPISKPLIQYTLEKLFASDVIDEIVIAGHRMLLEQRLGDFIKQFNKPCRIVNQNSKIPLQIAKQFNIKARQVKNNSIAGNLIKGYAASNAFGQKAHALFVACDSPLTSLKFIENFLLTAQKYSSQAAVIVPAVVISGSRDRLGRYPLKLRNDTRHQLPGGSDSYGRYGFRLSSVLMANPHLFDINTANTAYRLRKCLNPKVQVKLFKITRSLGYPNIYSKYFLRRDLSIQEVENITSQYFGGTLKLIPMIGEETTYDYDGTEFEYRHISKMLKR